MRNSILALLGVALAGCEMVPGMSSPPTPARMDAFVAMIEGAGCELPQEDNDALLDPAGFSDAEASALSQRLLVDGRAEVSPEGNLILLTENCA
jgi:hypothetical protein